MIAIKQMISKDSSKGFIAFDRGISKRSFEFLRSRQLLSNKIYALRAEIHMESNTSKRVENQINSRLALR